MKKILFLLFIIIGINIWAAEPVKILAIGNSFSEDAVEEHLSNLARAEGLDVIICNMYIGGCSIERHVKNLRGNIPDYRYRKIDVNGKMIEVKGYTLEKVLSEEDWDYVSVQQASPLSGLPDSYFTLPELVSYIRERVPEDAVVMFHQTWAYSKDSDHRGYANYENDQMKMFDAIVTTVNQEIPKVGISLVIPSGIAIQNARTSVFGDELTRDGYHLSRPRGRYIAACTWLEAVLGVNSVGNSYCPEGMQPQECRIAQKAAHKAVKRPYKISKIK